MKHPSPRTAGLSRREILRVGGLSALGLSLADLFRLRQARAADGTLSTVKAKHCILIWLDGGPSHLDTFDLKPEAPEEVRGPFQPIATRAPGVQICEYMPQTAKVMDKVAVVRSVTSTLGEHNFGSHYLLTGYKPTPVLPYPSYGSVLARLRPYGGVLPANVAVPNYNAQGGAGFLPATTNPFATGGDPAKPEFKVRDLNAFPGISTARQDRRKQFLAAFDQFASAAEDTGQHISDPEFEQAYRLISSPEAKQAFDLSAEPPKVRKQYGGRTIGQSCLLARRLIEAGVPFVTVRDVGWDTHTTLFNRLKEGFTGGSVGKIPSLDLAFGALVSDLDQRGLLDETLVVMMGEFGRTPKINTSGGRDHWPRVFSVALAGGGIRGGQVVGTSDAHGESPADRPVLPEDLARTIYTQLGIDPDYELHTADGRPVKVNAGGKLVRELV